MEHAIRETGIEGNLPTWPGASAVYSKAYWWMEKNGANDALIKALNEGNENDIKAFFVFYAPGLTKEAREKTYNVLRWTE